MGRSDAPVMSQFHWPVNAPALRGLLPVTTRDAAALTQVKTLVRELGGAGLSGALVPLMPATTEHGLLVSVSWPGGRRNAPTVAARKQMVTAVLARLTGCGVCRPIRVVCADQVPEALRFDRTNALGTDPYARPFGSGRASWWRLRRSR